MSVEREKRLSTGGERRGVKKDESGVNNKVEIFQIQTLSFAPEEDWQNDYLPVFKKVIIIIIF